MSNSEDTLMEIYLEVEKLNIRKEFETALKKLLNNPKYQYKEIAECQEIALEEVKKKLQ